MRIWDGINSDPGSGMEKIWILDKYPGSATLQSTVKKDNIEETSLFRQVQNLQQSTYKNLMKDKDEKRRQK